MSTENNPNGNKNRTDNDADSQSQNNNGNIGREVEEEREGSGSFRNLSANVEDLESTNEEGHAENQEHHWVGNHGQRSSNRPSSQEMDSFSDLNITDGIQQNRGRNHVTNAGGTSQEDLEKGKTGLTDSENES